MTADLPFRHRDTLQKIFRHSSSANIEWRQVLSLLEAAGSVTRLHNGKVKVAIGAETETFRPPGGKDIDEAMLVDLRRMLINAGLAEAAE